MRQARSGALILSAAILCGQAPEDDGVTWDPPFLLEAKCRNAPPHGCVCGTVFLDILPFDDLAFLVQMLVEDGNTWLSREQRWLDQEMAGRFLSRWRAECSSGAEPTPAPDANSR
jgi:hypothetical protein